MSLSAGSKKPTGLHKVHTHHYSFVLLRPFPDQQDVSPFFGVYVAPGLPGAPVRSAQARSGGALMELARFALRHPLQVPMGFANFDKNYVSEGSPPQEWAERLYDVRRWTAMPSGGHFGAAEKPEHLARDIAAFFAEL